MGAFLGVLVCLPLLLKWLKQRIPGRFSDASGQSRFISALAVGPHQRVVTVEVGPEGRRVWLTLGVTGQSISCLHCVDVAQSDTTNVTDHAAIAPGLVADQSLNVYKSGSSV